MNKLHPGAKWIFRMNFYYYFLGIIIFFTVFSFAFLRLIQSALIFFIPLAVIFLIIIFGEIYAQLSYNRFLFEIGHGQIKIEQGIIWKRYSSIPYERIQNVDIHRGIIARLIGFSSLDIQTAGYSGNYQYGFRINGRRTRKSEGYLPAIDPDGAEKIREFVVKKIKHAHKESEGI